MDLSVVRDVTGRVWTVVHLLCKIRSNLFTFITFFAMRSALTESLTTAAKRSESRHSSVVSSAHLAVRCPTTGSQLPKTYYVTQRAKWSTDDTSRYSLMLRLSGIIDYALLDSTLVVVSTTLPRSAGEECVCQCQRIVRDRPAYN